MERLLSVGMLFAQCGIVAFIVCLFAWCCGEESYHVSGVVLFDGKPIPRGQIYFFPDESRGNTGAAGYATIRHGAFDTAALGGKGAAGGPMVIGIDGVDPSARIIRPPSGHSGEIVFRSLFPHYRTTLILPEGDSTAHFEVPGSAADRQVLANISERTTHAESANGRL